MASKATDRDDALSEAKVITKSLKRANQSMHYGTTQMLSVLDILERDGQVIRDTLDIQKSDLKDELKSSKSRLVKIKNLQQLEKWVLRMSLFFFGAVVVYIIAKRLRVIQMTTFILSVSKSSKESNITKNNFDSSISDISPKIMHFKIDESCSDKETIKDTLGNEPVLIINDDNYLEQNDNYHDFKTDTTSDEL